MNKRTDKHCRNGFVLITVLLLTVLLAAMVLAFHRMSRVSVCRAGEYYHQKQATYYAAGGVQNFLAMVSEHTVSENSQGRELEAEGTREISFGQGGCEIAWTLENGKLNVNSLTERSGGVNRAAADQLLRLIDQWNQRGRGERISYGFVPSLIDWIDADDEVTVLPWVKGENRGAETPDYAGGMGCRNEPIESLGELRYVRYGGMGLINRAKTENPDGGEFPCLGDALTVYGEDKIAINAAGAAVIQSLGEGISSELARGIVEARKRAMFSSIDDVKNVPGVTAEIAQAISLRITFRPAVMYYRVTAVGYAEEERVKVSAVIRQDRKEGTAQVIRYLEEEMEDPTNRSMSR